MDSLGRIPAQKPLQTPANTSKHRLPTISAADALEEIEKGVSLCVPTGIQALDEELGRASGVLSFENDGKGGVRRGVVTEVWGPPGVGKSALGMQIAANALVKGEEACWIDCATPLSGTRLHQVVSSTTVPSSPPSLNTKSSSSTKPSYDHTQDPDSSPLSPPPASPPPPPPPSPYDLLKNFKHITTPTLPHFLSLFIPPPVPSSILFPPPNNSVLIIDSLSTLIASTFPLTLLTQPQRKSPHPSQNNGPHPPRPTAPQAQYAPTHRKTAVISHILTSLQRLALQRNIAIVVLTGAATKMQPGARARLAPAIGGAVWENGVGARITLWRDFGATRWAIVKGSGAMGGEGRPMPYVVTPEGVKDAPPVEMDESPRREGAMRKRRRREGEVIDSEDDEDADSTYGWAPDLDGDLLAQTQASLQELEMEGALAPEEPPDDLGVYSEGDEAVEGQPEGEVETEILAGEGGQSEEEADGKDTGKGSGDVEEAIEAQEDAAVEEDNVFDAVHELEDL